MHTRMMGLFKKQHASSFCEYAPIAAALLQPSMDDDTLDSRWSDTANDGQGASAVHHKLCVWAGGAAWCRTGSKLREWTHLCHLYRNLRLWTAKAVDRCPFSFIQLASWWQYTDAGNVEMNCSSSFTSIPTQLMEWYMCATPFSQWGNWAVEQHTVRE